MRIVNLVTELAKDLKRNLKEANFSVIKFVFLVAIGLSIPVTVYLAQHGFFKTSKAAVSATFSFSPNTFILPTDKTLSLLLNTGTDKIGFAQAEIKFDQFALKLTGFSLGTKLTRVISQSDIASANQTGSFRLAVGLEPSAFAAAPSGTFELGKFTFSKNTDSPNVSRTIVQDSSKSQVVTLEAQEATISPAGAAAIINPQVSCSSISLVDTVVTGATLDRVRMRIRNNSTQMVYLTGSKISWTSLQTGLTVDWFAWGGSQYYAGDSSISPTIYNPTGLIVLPPGATGNWIARFKGQPATGLKGTFRPELTVNLTCTYVGAVTR